MTRALWVLVLLTTPLAGCFGNEPMQPVQEAPQWSVGEWFEYSVTDADGNFTSLFVVAPGVSDRARHFDHGYVPRPTYDSIFMHLDEDLTPLEPGWGDLLSFPLREGKQYAAVVDGHNVTMELSGSTVEGDFGELQVFRAHVVEGPDIIEVTYSPQIDGYATIEWRDPDTGEPIESWRILDAGFNLPHGGPVPWDEGDWWRFDAMWQGLQGDVTLVHTGRKEVTFEVGTLNVMVLETVDFSDRLVATPFNQIQPTNLHPRSGSFSTVLPKTYALPLVDNGTWSSFSGRIPIGALVTYDPEVPVAGGTAYGFNITVRSEDGIIAEYDYVPAVKWFTRFVLKDPRTFETILDWRLLDFGSQYVGPLDQAQQALLADDSVSGGQIDGTFDVGDDVDSIEVELRIVQTQGGGQPNITLIDPDGDVQLRVETTPCGRPSCFRPDARSIPASPGTWTIQVDAPSSSTVQYIIESIAIETVQMDYS